MPNVNHVNYPNTKNKIYCRKRDNVVTFDNNHQTQYCQNCEMYAGSAQGQGVECQWFDTRKDIDNPRIVIDPYHEGDQITVADVKKPKEKLTINKKTK